VRVETGSPSISVTQGERIISSPSPGRTSEMWRIAKMTANNEVNNVLVERYRELYLIWMTQGLGNAAANLVLPRIIFVLNEGLVALGEKIEIYKANKSKKDSSGKRV